MGRQRLQLVRGYLKKAAVFVLLALSSAGAGRAAEPAHYAFLPAPPGTVVQSRLVYLSGEAMHGQWRAVVSRKAVGHDADETFYQWYLSIYAIDADGNYKLRYQAPSKTAKLLDVVEKASGATIWFPRQSMEIVGVAPLMAPDVQQLVVAVHQTGADCGSATLTIFRFDQRANKVVPAVSLANGCTLDASIVNDQNGAALRLRGPYYGPNDAMCCPTKQDASATLRYSGGKWVLKPAYYQTFVGKYAFE